MKAVILAAGVGSRLRPYTDQLPKSLVPMNNKPILGHILDALSGFSFSEIVVVTGFRADQIEGFFSGRPENVRFLFNTRFDTAGNGVSLLTAEEAVLGHDFVKLDADLVFEPLLLQKLLDAPGDLRLMVDVHPCGEEEMKVRVDDQGRILDLSKEIPPEQAWGESIGMEFCTAQGSRALFESLHGMLRDGLDQAYYEEAYGRMARAGVHVTATEVPPGVKWFEIDTIEDLHDAQRLFGGPKS